MSVLVISLNSGGGESGPLSDLGHSSDQGDCLAWCQVRRMEGRSAVASEEIGGYIILICWGLMLWGAIKVFGFRRVALVALWIVVLAVGTAFRTLGAFTDTRRY
jgi:hypothetical protein